MTTETFLSFASGLDGLLNELCLQPVRRRLKCSIKWAVLAVSETGQVQNMLKASICKDESWFHQNFPIVYKDGTWFDQNFPLTLSVCEQKSWFRFRDAFVRIFCNLETTVDWDSVVSALTHGFKAGQLIYPKKLRKSRLHCVAWKFYQQFFGVSREGHLVRLKPDLQIPGMWPVQHNGVKTPSMSPKMFKKLLEKNCKGQNVCV